MEEVTKRLHTMEELLVATAKQNRRLLVAAACFGILLLLFVGIFGVGFYMLNQTISEATQDLPALVETVSDSVQKSSVELNLALQDIQGIDFAGLNGAIQSVESGVGSVNFEALNRSILDLQIASQRLAVMMSIFG